MIPYILFGALVVYLIVKDGIRTDRENRKLRPGTKEFIEDAWAPYAGIEKKD
jgi:hypothetical protein